MKLRRLLLAVFLILAGASVAYSQVPVSLAPSPNVQFLDNTGKTIPGGCLFSYAAGTTNPQATYTDSTGGSQNTNPVILDAAGRANVWLTSASYKLVLKTPGGVNCASGSQLWSVDGITGQLGLLSLTNIWSGQQTFSQPIIITPSVNQIVTGTTPNQTTLNFPAPSGAKTLTFPNTTDTMVGRATTDTLANKTLTSPTITGTVSGSPAFTTPTITNPVLPSWNDVTEIAAPANPSSGTQRLYADNSSHKLACLTSGGLNCLSGLINQDGSQTSVNGNTSALQNLKSYVFSAGSLNILGKTLRVQASGQLTFVNTTETVVVQAQLGGAAIISESSYVPTSTACCANWYADVHCITTTIGTNGAISCGSLLTIIDGAGVAKQFIVSGIIGTPVNLTLAQTLQYQVSFTTASATNVGAQNQLIVELLN